MVAMVSMVRQVRVERPFTQVERARSRSGQGQEVITRT